MRMQPAFLTALAIVMGWSGGASIAQETPKVRTKSAQPSTKEATPAPVSTTEQDATEKRDQQVMERFKTVLERTPRRGTALDRVYGYHVERGTLDALLGSYAQRVKDDPKDGAGWLLLGLFEAQRGRDAAAVEALRQAEQTRPNDALPSYYLGQALVLVGQPDAAAEAFERSLTRKPARADLLEIFQALGRVHQRAHRADKALEVWSRLEALFPDDLRIQEQIASALAEEDQSAPALERYEKLAGKVTDRYRQVQLKLEAAGLKVKIGKGTDALADFEALLGKLDPDSWLARDVRRKIEDVFLRRDDLQGLAKYYESWIAKTPDDVDAVARLARIYGQLGKGEEARGSLEKAVKLAPSRKELRVALIELLRQRGDIAGAAAQYEALHKNDPNDPDILREWGRMLFADTSKPEAARKQAAAEIWKRLVKDDAKDPVSIAQAADLFRQANLVDDAIKLYQRAVALAPDAPQYREYLGEYYHHLKRSPEALATWRETVQGPAHTAKNLGRLGEVMAGFGYRKEALEPLNEAVKLEGDDLDLRLKLADVLLALDKPLEADEELARAEKLATDDDQNEAVLTRRIKAFLAANVLPARIETLAKELASRPGDAKGWTRLALYQEANGKVPEAVLAATSATKADPRSIPAWTVLARLQESSGNLLAAADANRNLAALDRRARTDYLTNIAKLEARLGRREAALKAGRDLLAAAPGNPDHDQFFAELCFGLGESDEGLEALRRSVRANPSEPKIMLTLAENLARQFRTEEAIELFWRAFEKSPEIDAKLSVVARLTDQYLQRNQFDRLLARLEREIREQDRQREKSLCMAQAFQSSGDFSSARAELEKLLGSNSRDVQLLSQLAGLAEAEGDLSTAAKYLKQAVEITPSNEALQRLAMLYSRAGESAEAEAIWARMADEDKDPARTLAAIDSLIGFGKSETVLGLTDRLLVKNPGNWELLYREGVALMNQEKPADATRRFTALLDLRLGDDELSSQAKARNKASTGVAGARIAQRSANINNLRNSGFPLQQRTYSVSQIRAATKLESNYYNNAGNAIWMPGDFGQARMAALAWLYSVARTEKKSEEWEKAKLAALDKPPTDSRALWDLYYSVLLMQRGGTEIHRASLLVARALANDLGAEWALLTSLQNRNSTAQSRYRTSPSQRESDAMPPLAPADLELALKCFEDVRKRRIALIDVTMITSLATELKRAKRETDADRLYQELIKNPATEPESQNAAIQIAAERGDVDSLIKIGDRYLAEVARKQPGYYDIFLSSTLSRALASRVEAKKFPDAIRLIDYQLASMQRPDLVALRAKSRSLGSSSAMNRPYSSYWLGKNQRSIIIDFPSPNIYFDAGAINVLRTAFENYKQADLLSDLIGHFRKLAASAKPGEKLYPTLALGYLLWWNDDKDDALQVMTQAAESAPTDIELKLSLAELRSSRGEQGDALELADSVEPLDQKTTQRRELLALRLSVLAGDVARAQQAAERLFGLRLDNETQLMLAAQMNQLGQQDLADAVLARARRRAGGVTSTLVSLMNQYQRQGKSEPALQIANQILRASGGSVRAYTPYNSENDSARTEAIGVITRSGKLKELVDRAEAQLKISPKSVQLLQTLVDYYQAMGEKDKVKATYKRLIEIRPEDAKMRFQVGLQFQRAGNADEAIEHFKAALKKEPSLFAQRYWEVQNAFQQANKLEDLTKVLDEIDLKTMQSNYYAITNIVQNLMQNDRQREMAMKLFRKAWKELPESRSELIGNVYSEELWRTNEMYDYARQAIIPTGSGIVQDPWIGVNQISSYSSGGRVNGILHNLIEAASRQNKLDELRNDIAEAIKKTPGWHGGKALQALLDIRAGRVDEGKKTLESLEKVEPPMPSSARMLIGQALDKVPALIELEVALYEGAIKEADPSGIINEFEYGPAARLVELYKQTNRGKQGRELLLRYAGKSEDRYGDPAYAAYQKMNNSLSFARSFLDLGFPADAARFYAEVLDDNEAMIIASSWAGNMDQLRRQAATGMEQALGGMKPEVRGATLRAVLTPRPNSPKDQQAIDLGLIAYPRDLDKASITSLLAEAIRSSVKEKDPLDEPRASLKKLQAERPTDLSVAIAEALLVAAEHQPDRLKAEAEKLVAMLEKQPLEPMAAGVRPNARQRAEAQPRVGLWLIARECRKHEATRALGDRLSAEAREAARRQSDQRWTLAILREAGQDAATRGDKAEAERLWREMLKQVMIRPEPRPTKPNPARQAIPAAPAARPRPTTSSRTNPQVYLARFQSPAAAPLRLRPAAPARSGAQAQQPPTSIVTLDRFTQALQIAKLAAENDLVDLSLDAVREALATGPPITPVAMPQGSIRVIRNGDPQATETSAQVVEQKLSALIPVWRKSKVSADRLYATLRDVVLPPSRPGEVFLYSRPLFASLEQGPSSVAELLARAAVEAGKSDDLIKLLETRQAQPLAGVPARALLALVAIATKKPEDANTRFKSLLGELKKNTTFYLAEQACAAALVGLKTPEVAVSAKLILQETIKPAADTGNEQPLGSLLLKLARFEFKTGDIASGKQHLTDYQTKTLQSVSRYAGDYSVHRRRMILIDVANEYARAMRLEDTLDALGQFADAPSMSNYGIIDITEASRSLDQMLAKLSAAERYRLLSAWILPEANRATVRHLVSTAPRTPKDAQTSSWLGDRFTSPTLHLISAAREAKKLDELAANVAALVAKKTPEAEKLQLVIQFAQGKGNETLPWLRNHLAEIKKSLDTRTDQAPPQQVQPTTPSIRLDTAEALLAHLVLTDPGTESFAEEYANVLIQKSRQLPSGAISTQLQTDLARLLARRQRAKPPTSDPGLAHWSPSPLPGARGDLRVQAPIWVESEGVVSQVVGSTQHSLTFNYPLTGTFEISADVWQGGWGEGSLAFQGIVFEPATRDYGSRVSALADGDYITCASIFTRREAFNRLTIKVSPKKVQYLVNGHLFFEELSPGDTAPWFGLTVGYNQKIYSKNVQITGSPVLPREIKLVEGDRFNGWVATFPSRRASRFPAPRLAEQRARDGMEQVSWEAKQGELLGNKRTESIGSAFLNTLPNQLTYARPMADGDTLSYEFWYEPGVTEVNPMLDRLCFLLDPERGVREVTNELSAGDSSDNEANTPIPVDVPVNRRGPAKLPLKSKDWNQMTLAYKAGRATLALNGQPIYDRAIEPTNTRRFGLSHDATMTNARVRAVTLRGNWPEKLSADVLQNLLARRPDPTDQPADLLARQAIIGEQILVQSSDDVWKRSRLQPPAERYETLVAWVLPSSTHATFRLQGSFCPTNTATVVAIPGYEGGEVIAPVVELVKVAQELKKLDDLAARVASTKPTNPLDVRGKLALTAVIEHLRGRSDEAAKALAALVPLQKELGSKPADWKCWPEVIAATLCGTDDKLRPACLKLIDDTVTQADWSTWGGHVRQQRARIRLLDVAQADRPKVGGQTRSDQWASVIGGRSNTFGTGDGLPTWLFANNTWTHYPSHSFDQLYLKTPLTGDFEINCEVTPFDYREIRVSYSGTAVGLRYDLKSHDLYEFGREKPHRPIPAPAFDKIGDWLKFRLVVKAGKYQAFVNDRKIYEENLPSEPEPWVAFVATRMNMGSVRNLKISGNPTVPDMVKLSHRPTLFGWLDDYYPSDHFNQAPLWRKSGEEIIGDRFPKDDGTAQTYDRYGNQRGNDTPPIAGSKVESILKYHRPLMEDGELAYEFFYDPAKTMVHPALGRLAFVLDPEGIKVHWLTDGPSDRTGLDPGNLSEEPKNRRGPAKLPLQAGQWNKLLLKIKGDTVALELNGQAVYERPLESTNLRDFGLFHYADETEARVRQVTYRGNWPKALDPELKAAASK